MERQLHIMGLLYSPVDDNINRRNDKICAFKKKNGDCKDNTL